MPCKPKGPFRTKNAMAPKTVVFYYCRSILLCVLICCAIFPKKNSIFRPFTVVNRYGLCDFYYITIVIYYDRSVFSLVGLCEPSGLLQESLGLFRPEVSRECPLGCLWGPSSPALRSVQKVSRECPGVSKKVSQTLRDALGTLFGHSGARGSKGPKDTPRDDSWNTSGRRAQETPVAGRGF